MIVVANPGQSSKKAGGAGGQTIGEAKRSATNCSSPCAPQTGPCLSNHSPKLDIHQILQDLHNVNKCSAIAKLLQRQIALYSPCRSVGRRLH